MFGLTLEKLFLVTLVAGLVVGPRRIPVYAARLGSWVRSFRPFVEATKVRTEDELGVPLRAAEWRSALQQYDPRRIVREALADDASPGDAKPDDGRPDDARPDDGRPDDAKPDDGRPGDAKPDDGRPDDARPDDGRPDDAKPDDGRPDAGDGTFLDHERTAGGSTGEGEWCGGDRSGPRSESAAGTRAAGATPGTRAVAGGTIGPHTRADTADPRTGTDGATGTGAGTDHDAGTGSGDTTLNNGATAQTRRRWVVVGGSSGHPRRVLVEEPVEEQADARAVEPADEPASAQVVEPVVVASGVPAGTSVARPADTSTSRTPREPTAEPFAHPTEPERAPAT
jgi:sec-independent protein translocase protein TatB